MKVGHQAKPIHQDQVDLDTWEFEKSTISHAHRSAYISDETNIGSTAFARSSTRFFLSGTNVQIRLDVIPTHSKTTTACNPQDMASNSVCARVHESSLMVGNSSSWDDITKNIIDNDTDDSTKRTITTRNRVGSKQRRMFLVRATAVGRD